MSKLPVASSPASVSGVSRTALGSDYVCFSYHTNVDVGDSAIHIWVDISQGRTGNKMGLIQRAVLVDGGHSNLARTALEAIRATLWRIEHDFTIPGDGILKFDSIVITHWDEDHWGGIQDLLISLYSEDIAEILSTTNIPNLANPITYLSPHPAFATRFALPITSLRPEMNLQCRRFKYDNTYAPTTAPLVPDATQWLAAFAAVKKDDPRWNTNTDWNGPGAYATPTNLVPDVVEPDVRYLQTTLYVPYTYTTGPTVTDSRIGSPESDVKDEYSNKVPFWSSNNGVPYDVSNIDPTSNVNILDLAIPFEYTLVSDTTAKPKRIKARKRTKLFKIIGAARLCGHYQHYLGAELFRNIPLPQSAAGGGGGGGLNNEPWRHIVVPQMLTDAHGVLQQSGPCMFIVAGYQNLLGLGTGPNQIQFSDPPTTKATDLKLVRSAFSVKVIAPKILQEDVLPADREKNSHKMNAPSIICMIMMESRTVLPDFTQPTRPVSVKLRHYFGGDALWDVEKALLNWMTNLGCPAKIPVMKLSHHGATESSPIDVLEQMDPDFMIITNSSGSGFTRSFGHPRYELLFYLHALRLKAVKNKVLKPIGVYPLNYPHYLIDDNEKKSFSLDVFTKDFETLSDVTGEDDIDNALLVYRLRLEALYAAVGVFQKKEDMLDRYRSETYRIRGLDLKRDFVANLVKEIWPMLSLYREDQFTARGQISRIEALIGQDIVQILPSTRGGGTLKQPFAAWSAATFPQLDPGNRSLHAVAKLRESIVMRNAPIPVSVAIPTLAPTSAKDQTASTNRVQAALTRPRFPDIEGLPKSTSSTGLVAYPDDLALQSENLGYDGDCEAGILGAGFTVASDNLTPTANLAAWRREQARVLPEVFPTRSPALTIQLTSSARAANTAHTLSSGPAPESASSTPPAASRPLVSRGSVQPIAPSSLSARAGFSQSTQIALGSPAGTNQPIPNIVSNTTTRDTVVVPQAGCFLLGADFTAGSSDGVSEVLVSDAVFSQFVANLSSGAISLETAFSSDGTVATIGVFDYDPWLRSVQSNGVFTTAMFFTGSLTNQQAVITAFSATLTIGSNVLQFSTDDTARILGIPATTTVPAPTSLSESLVPDYQILVAGLSKSQRPLTFQLSQVLQLIAGTTVQLPGFVDDFTLTCDNSNNSGSAVYYQPDTNYTTDLRLKFIATNGESKLKDLFGWLAKELDFLSLSNTSAVIHKTARISDMAPDYGLFTACHVTFSTEVTIILDSKTVPPTTLDFTIWIVFGQTTTRLVIRFNSAEDPATLIEKALDWVADRFAGFVGLDIHPSTLLPPGDMPIRLRQMEFDLSNPDGGSGFTMVGANIDFEITLFTAVFRVTLSWPEISLTAGLWLADTDIGIGSLRMLPSREDFDVLEPFAGELPSFIRISDLVPAAAALPSGIPDLITELQFTAWKNSADSGFQFTGKIKCEAPSSTPTKMPILRIGELALFADYDFTDNHYDVRLSTTIFLFPRIYPDLVDGLTPARLDLSVEDDDGVWTLFASLTNLKLALLWSLFDSDSSPSVMNVMKHFDILELDITYMYDGSLASSFSMVGILGIGPFELDLEYTYDSTGWKFQAYLGSRDSSAATLGALIETIAGPGSNIAELLEEVPFVNNIAIPGTPGVGMGNSSTSAVQLEVVKSAGYVVFWIQLNILTKLGTISVTFIQLQDSTPTSSQAGSDGAAPLGKPKRIIRVNVNNIPSLPSVPVVGTLPVPFDDLEYLWVQDPNNTTPGTPAGFTRAEIDMINSALRGQPILFRDTTPNPPSATASSNVASTAATPVLLVGHHFVVSSDGKVVVDHLFGSSSPTTNQNVKLVKAANPPSHSLPFHASTIVVKTASSKATPGTDVAGNDSGTTIGSTKKSIGPLSIQNLGLQLKDGYLYIHVDATVALGTIIMTFVGFAVGLPISKINLSKMSTIRIEDFSVKLDGLSVYMDSPPLLVAGTFISGSSAVSEFYKGGITLSILPYTLLAVGAYERVYATPTTREYKSVFIFARLDGPLFSLEFAEITGVKAGFGYNSLMKLPEASEIMSYPLVEGSGLNATNPMDVLTSFGSWVSAADGPMWFAIGMKVSAFEVLSIDAALLLSFSPSPTIAVIADAIASMPPDAPREACFLYVELGIIGAIDIAGGSFKVEAQLSPNSFILYPACHLTGGFAMCYWFTGSPFAGDWVFTVGGYHPAYKPPNHYPNPPRLGISWNLDDCLTISGESFFAVTPSCVMGGGRLLAVFNAGPLSAHFEAWASFLINFKPFHFIGDIGISVGVSFNIDIWIIHIHISVELGANLHLQGPPFGGVAHVDFYVFGFDVYFGDQDDGPKQLDWAGFRALVQQPGPSTTDPTKSNPSLLVVAIEQGAIDEKTDNNGQIARKTGDMWYVRAGTFQFRVESKFAMNKASCGDGIKDLTENDPDSTVDSPNSIYARPMWKDVPLTSELNIEIVLNPPSVPTPAPSSVPATTPPTPVTPVKDDSNYWNLKPIMRNLPSAIWSQYSKNTDPSHGGNSIGALLDGTAGGLKVEHLCGLTIHSPNPRLPAINMDPFNALDAMREDIFQLLSVPILPGRGDTQALFLPSTQPRPDGNGDDVKWESVRKTWQDADPNGQTAEVAEIWSSMFGWNAPVNVTPNAVRTTDPPPPAPTIVYRPLVPSKPAAVLDTANFGTYYLDLPFVGALDLVDAV